MTEYEIGYKKPPKHSQFKKGAKPNCGRKGRAHTTAKMESMRAVLDAKVEVRENGKTRRLSRLELTIKTFFNAALKGDVSAADALLKMVQHAEKYGDSAPFVVKVLNALPPRGEFSRP